MTYFAPVLICTSFCKILWKASRFSITKIWYAWVYQHCCIAALCYSLLR